MSAAAMPAPYTALVLAGSRGPGDPVAVRGGVRHKALVPVAGVPMLSRVLRTLADSPYVWRIAVCLDDATALAELPEAAELRAAGRLVVVPPAGSPSRSVAEALRRVEAPFPMLVTTADHPLLRPEMIAHFCDRVPAEADVAVALAPASIIRRAYPGAVRTFYRLGNERYSGCNLFAFRTPAARRAAEFWTAMERHRKKPWRLIAAIGPLTLLRFGLGLLDLSKAERLLSRRVGATVRVVEMPFAEAAIDVDKPADLDLAETILRGRPT
jgi:CTP:molybdopterin cytidylyltransferase MocA